MTISNRKIAVFQKLIANLATHPNDTLSDAQLKAYWDSSPEELRVAVNGLIDDLILTTAGNSGADNIGAATIAGLTGATVQGIMQALKNKIDSVNPVAGFVSIVDFPVIAPETNDGPRIQRAINSLQAYNTLLIPPGTYNVGDLTLSTQFTTLDCRGALNYIGTGSCLTISGYDVTVKTPNIKRVYAGTGVASADLLYTGIDLKDAKEWVLDNPRVEGFGIGICLHDTLGAGSAYGTIINPTLINNLVSYKCIKGQAGSWTTETKMFGGRISLVGAYSNYTGSAYFDLLDNAHRFFGVCAEGTVVERKIKGNFDICTWEGCRFEGTNGLTDIEITGAGNVLIGNYDSAAKIVNTGLHNTIISYFSSSLGSTIQYPTTTFKSEPAAKNLTISNDYSYYLVDSFDNKTDVITSGLSDDISTGKIIVIKKTDSSANEVAMTFQVDGTLIYPKLLDQNQSITLMYMGGGNWKILSNDPFAFTLGNNHITYGVGYKLKYCVTDPEYTKYNSKVCVQEGTTGTLTAVTATGNIGEFTVTLANVATNTINNNSWITINANNYHILTWTPGTGVATLSTALLETLAGASVSRRNPIFRKTDRIINEQTAAPTTGTWVKGDIVYNSNPAAGGYVGWVCVTAGTPGTWKGFGLIQA